MSNKQSQPDQAPSRIAVLLHLASTENLTDFVNGLKQLGCDYDVCINLVRGLNSEETIRQQTTQLQKAFAAPEIIVSENRGMDVGGMFRLFSHIQGRDYSAILYMHSKSNTHWRRVMIRQLTRRDTRTVLQSNGDTQAAVGMVGTYLYPYDYFNLNPYLELIKQLELEVRFDWRAFPYLDKIQGFSAIDKAKWATSRNLRQGRPELDLEYARAKFDLTSNAQHMNRDLAREFINDGVFGALPYFPGNFFWLSADAFNLLAKKLDFAEEANKLPVDLKSDKTMQSRAHAWERILPVFVLKQGLRIHEMLPRQ